MPRQFGSVTLEDARRVIAAGECKAIELKIPYNIAVITQVGDRPSVRREVGPVVEHG